MQTRNRILVELVLQSGAHHHFEITEAILNDLEEFRQAGLSPRDLCRTWLQVASWDAPACLRGAVFKNLIFAAQGIARERRVVTRLHLNAAALHHT